MRISMRISECASAQACSLAYAHVHLLSVPDCGAKRALVCRRGLASALLSIVWRIQWYRTSFGASDTSDGEEHISQASPAPTAAAATAAAAEALRSLTTQRVGLGLRKQRPITWRSTRAPTEENREDNIQKRRTVPQRQGHLVRTASRPTAPRQPAKPTPSLR